MNRSSLRHFARAKLGDLSTDPTLQTWGDSDYNTALIQSAYFIQGRLAKVNAYPYTKITVTNLSNGVGDYPLPSDIVSPGVRRVYTLQSGVYVPATLRNLESLEDTVRDAAVSQVGEDPTTASTRVEYTIDGDYIELSPVPTANTTNGLRIRYAAAVTMADDNSIPQLPLALHDAVWLHTAAKLAPQQDDSFIKTLASQYNEIIGTYLEAFKNRFGNEPEQIEEVGGVDKVGWSEPATADRATRY